LGIDPGSLVMGYGLIESDGVRSRHLESGALRLGTGDMPARLKLLFEGVTSLVRREAPEQAAVECVFMNKNADSALKLGQARGVVIAALAVAGVPVFEYAPRAIKQAVVGTGGAAKEQVQHMVGVLLGLKGALQADAADALAVALCHGHRQSPCAALPRVPSSRRRGLRWSAVP
jgi:crossover junction endodeoxyribonuclease RuvC